MGSEEHITLARLKLVYFKLNSAVQLTFINWIIEYREKIENWPKATQEIKEAVKSAPIFYGVLQKCSRVKFDDEIEV